MNLAFNGIASGLGNNGGTRTILLCQKTLEELGHRCDFISGVDNFTWFDHKPVINYLPDDLDAIISVACSDVAPTLSIDVPKKAWYIRGHENWSMSNQDLGHLYRDPRFLNIVNSKGLQHMLDRKFHAHSAVVYQGVDFHEWKDRKLRGDKIRIGCLSNKRHVTKRWEDFVALSQILGRDDYEYVAFGHEPREDTFLNGFIQIPSHDDLVNLYSSCHIWFAPTELEGLHNPAIEAALCGCLLLANDRPLNGMILDYAFNNETAMIYKARDIEHAAQKVKNPSWNLIPAMSKCIRTNIGSRKDNMKKLVKHLEGEIWDIK
jgi:hypothetical protein